MENPFRTEQDIFNGRFKLITEDNEFGMSLWVKGFGIAESASGNVVLDIIRQFDLVRFEEAGTRLKVNFRIYPNGSKHYDAEIDPFERTFFYNGQTLNLEHFATTLEKEADA